MNDIINTEQEMQLKEKRVRLWENYGIIAKLEEFYSFGMVR